MATSNSDVPVIVIGESDTSNGEAAGHHFEPHTKMVLHTGNIATWNSLKTRKTQVPANELHHCLQRTIKNWLENVSEKKSANSHCAETFESDDERSLIRVTIKVLLHKFDMTFLEEAVRTTLASMKIKYFDTLILSLPPVEDRVEPFQDIILPYWTEMEKLYSAGVASKLSSCDLDKEKLESLMHVATVKPEINQVNLTSCCHMPQVRNCLQTIAYFKRKRLNLRQHY